MAINYIYDLNSDFFNSQYYTSLLLSMDEENLTKEQIDRKGIYKDENAFFIDKQVDYQDVHGILPVRVFIVDNPDGTYNLRTVGVNIAYPIDDAIDNICGAFGIENIENIKDELKQEVYQYIQDATGKAPEENVIDIIIDKFGKSVYDKSILDVIYDYMQSKYNPLSISFTATSIKYPVGNQMVTEFKHEDMGKVCGWQLYNNNLTVVNYTPNQLNDFITDLIQTDEIAEVLNTHPFVKVGFGETGYDHHFSFLVLYFYDVDDNRIVVTDHGNYQTYGVQYSSYYTLDINNVPDVPQIGELVFHDNTGSIQMQNRWHSWDRAHALGCIDLIGWLGESKPFTVTGTPPSNLPLEQNYPEWTPVIINNYPFFPISPIIDIQTNIWLGILPPNIKLRPKVLIGFPPEKPEDEPPPQDIEPDVTTKECVYGLYHVFEMSYSKVLSLGNWLWDETNIETRLNKILQIFKNNPLDAIISLHQIYVPPTTTTEREIQLGYVKTGITAPTIEDRYVEFSCGDCNVDRYFNDVRDYDTQLSVYLPFIGVRELDIKECLGARLRIHYQVDIMTGDCTATISKTKLDGKNKIVLGMYNGNCASPLPLTGADKTQLYSNMASAGVGIVGGLMTGGVGGAVASGVKSVLNMGTKHNIQIQRSGNIGGNYGAMASKKAYLMFVRPIPCDALERGQFIGKPCNISVNLSRVTGYSEFRGVHVDTISSALPYEREQIEQLLTSGVIM